MEIGGVSSSSISYSSSQRSLTDEQKSSLEEILSKYDAENLTNEDKQSLRKELRVNGIPRTRETGQYLAQAGFSPGDLRPEGQGGVVSGRPAERQGGVFSGRPAMGDDEEEDGLLSLIEQVNSGELSQEEFMDILEQYAQDNGSLSNGDVIDKEV